MNHMQANKLLVAPPRTLLVLILATCAVAAIEDAHGHGIGAETLPPQSLDGDWNRQVFVEISSSTDAESGADQQFTFQMLDAHTNKPVEGVTYEIAASKRGAEIFHDTFESGSGTLVIDLIHDGGLEGTSIERKEPGIFGFVFGETDLAKITGPHFDGGGLYQFLIRIHTVGDYTNVLDSPLEWNAGVSLIDTSEYVFDDANFGEQVLTHTSYYDLIEDFRYDPSTRNITFSMHFDTSPEAINQTSVVHHEVSFSKGFGDLMVSDMAATVNGVTMPPETVQIDDFADGTRTVHLTVFQGSILELYEDKMIPDDLLSFVVGPAEPDLPMSAITKNGQFKIIMETIPADPSPGQELEVRHKLIDTFLKDQPIEAEYEMRVAQGDTVLFSTAGTSSDEGNFESAKFSIPAGITGIVHVYFENLEGNSLASASLPLVVDRKAPASTDDPAGSVPGWVKINAGLWADGTISDGEFVAGIEFLIKAGVIRV